MSTEENKRKHLDFIQLTITRMAANSFLLKAWGVALVAALFALSSKEVTGNKDYWLLAFLPIISFWILDAYYLHQEKLFRELYDEVRNMNPEKIDFSLKTDRFKKSVPIWPKMMYNHTLLVFYGTVAILLFGIWAITQ